MPTIVPGLLKLEAQLTQELSALDLQIVGLSERRLEVARKLETIKALKARGLPGMSQANATVPSNPEAKL